MKILKFGFKDFKMEWEGKELGYLEFTKYTCSSYKSPNRISSQWIISDFETFALTFDDISCNLYKVLFQCTPVFGNTG